MPSRVPNFLTCLLSAIERSFSDVSRHISCIRASETPLYAFSGRKTLLFAFSQQLRGPFQTSRATLAAFEPPRRPFMLFRTQNPLTYILSAAMRSFSDVSRLFSSIRVSETPFSAFSGCKPVSSPSFSIRKVHFRPLTSL